MRIENLKLTRKITPLLVIAAVLSMGVGTCERDTPLGTGERDGGAPGADAMVSDSAVRPPRTDAMMDDSGAPPEGVTHVAIETRWSNAARPSVSVRFFNSPDDLFAPRSSWSPDATKDGVVDTTGACEIYSGGEPRDGAYGPEARVLPTSTDAGATVQIGVGDQPLAVATHRESAARGVSYGQTTIDHGPYVAMDAPLPVQVQIDFPDGRVIRTSFEVAPLRVLMPSVAPMEPDAALRDRDPRFMAFATEGADLRFRWEPAGPRVRHPRVWMGNLGWPAHDPDETFFCNAPSADGQFNLPRSHHFPAALFGSVSTDFFIGSAEEMPVETIAGVQVLAENLLSLRIQEIRDSAR